MYDVSISIQSMAVFSVIVDAIFDVLVNQTLGDTILSSNLNGTTNKVLSNENRNQFTNA